MEKYIVINGFEDYAVSNLGNIKNIKRNILRKFQITNGYCRVIIKNKKVKKNILVHRLVAQAFIPNPENKKTVNHKDGNRKNNNVTNLEWCTQKENIKHSWSVLNREHGNNNKVLNTETGEIYKNIKEAALKNNIKYTTLVAMLSNINPNKTKLIKL